MIGLRKPASMRERAQAVYAIVSVPWTMMNASYSVRYLSNNRARWPQSSGPTRQESLLNTTCRSSSANVLSSGTCPSRSSSIEPGCRPPLYTPPVRGFKCTKPSSTSNDAALSMPSVPPVCSSSTLGSRAPLPEDLDEGHLTLGEGARIAPRREPL